MNKVSLTIYPRIVNEALQLINSARRQNGLKPLSLSDQLSWVANQHAQDEKRRGYCGHYTPEGLGPADRVNRARISWSAVAENLAGGPTRGCETGYTSIFEAHHALMNSLTHRANILGPYDTVGIGVASNPDGTIILVELFLKR